MAEGSKGWGKHGIALQKARMKHRKTIDNIKLGHKVTKTAS
jgi:hypothetical protein